MNKKTAVSVNRLDLLSISIAFIILKLCNVINWSWWWVLSPIWMPAATVLLILLFTLLRRMIIKLFEKKEGEG